MSYIIDVSPTVGIFFLDYIHYFFREASGLFVFIKMVLRLLNALLVWLYLSHASVSRFFGGGG